MRGNEAARRVTCPCVTAVRIHHALVTR
jgi:hypothetical protein